jgi:hypothetical protein
LKEVKDIMEKTPIITHLAVEELERLEFLGVRQADGCIRWKRNDEVYKDWPEFIVIAGIKFRYEGSEDDSSYGDEDERGEDEVGSLACYMIDC